MPSAAGRWRGGGPDRSIDRRALLARIEATEAFHFDELLARYYTPGEDKQAVRNQLVDVGIISIDQHYSMFLQEFAANRKVFEAGADIASIATDIAATLLMPTSTKSILAAISGGITASQATVSENYFYEQTMLALVKAMEAQRRTVLADLLGGLNQSVEAYPLAAALADLERYYLAGTIEGALASVQQSAADRQTAATEEISQARAEFARLGASLGEARRWLAENGAAAGRTSLGDWYVRTASSANPAALALRQATLTEALLNDQPTEVVVALLVDPQEQDTVRARALLESGSDADRDTFISEFASRLDFESWLRRTITPEGLARVAASFNAENPLGL